MTAEYENNLDLILKILAEGTELSPGHRFVSNSDLHEALKKAGVLSYDFLVHDLIEQKLVISNATSLGPKLVHGYTITTKGAAFHSAGGYAKLQRKKKLHNLERALTLFFAAGAFIVGLFKCR